MSYLAPQENTETIVSGSQIFPTESRFTHHLMISWKAPLI